MQTRRPGKSIHELTNGPGKLCAALGIDRTLDGADLCDAQSELFVARSPDLAAFLRKTGPPTVAKRIGITKAADWPLRFYLPGSAYLSLKPVAADLELSPRQP